jgi:hypothetical protein
VGLVGVKGRGALLGPEESGRLMGAVTVSSRVTDQPGVYALGWCVAGARTSPDCRVFLCEWWFVLVSARILRTV